jgi:hypothetical protein
VLYNAPRAIGILICGVGGATFAWIVVDALGWSGVGGAIITAMIGMVTATLLWATGVVLGKALRLIK